LGFRFQDFGLKISGFELRFGLGVSVGCSVGFRRPAALLFVARSLWFGATYAGWRSVLSVEECVEECVEGVWRMAACDVVWRSAWRMAGWDVVCGLQCEVCGQ